MRAPFRVSDRERAHVTAPARRLAERRSAEEAAAGVPAEQRTFFLEASGSPVLLLHGAGGSPADLRHLGHRIAAGGRPVLCPLLPEHGKGPEDLGGVRFRDLVDCAAGALETLSGRGPVDTVAQSLGAVLGLRLALDGRPIARLAALAPALRPFVLRRIWLLALVAPFRPRLARATWTWQWELLGGIRRTRDRLEEVRCPLLTLASRDDGSVSWRGARELQERSASGSKELVLLEGQGHVLSIAPDRETLVYPPVLRFLGITAPEDGSRTPDPRSAGA